MVLVTPARSAVFAQQSLAPLVPSGASPISYPERYAEVMGLAGDRTQIAEVNNLVLTRDLARFTLTSGRLYLLTPVGGRIVGAVFQGKGTFAFTPPSITERDRLARFEKTTSIDVPVSSFVFLFTDTTLAELRSKVTFGATLEPGDLHARIKAALDDLADEDSRSFHPDLMADFLNGDTSGLFYAQVVRSSGGPLMFMIDPNEVEGVTLRSKVSKRGWGRRAEVVCRFPGRAQLRERWTKGDRSRQADVQKYTIDVSLPPSGVGELGFSASARWRSWPIPPSVPGSCSSSSRSSRSIPRAGKAATPRRSSAGRTPICSGFASTARSVPATSERSTCTTMAT